MGCLARRFFWVGAIDVLGFLGVNAMVFFLISLLDLVCGMVRRDEVRNGDHADSLRIWR